MELDSSGLRSKSWTVRGCSYRCRQGSFTVDPRHPSWLLSLSSLLYVELVSALLSEEFLRLCNILVAVLDSYTIAPRVLAS